MRRSGVRIPLAPPQADIRSGCRFFVCLAWCCGACCCGALSPLVFRAPDRLPVGLAAVCAGGRRPAREIATREPDGSEWSISRPALALPPPTSTAARPSGPSGALHTSGAWLLMCGSVCRFEARPGHVASHGRRSLALRSLRHPSHLWAGALACALSPVKPTTPLQARDTHFWCYFIAQRRRGFHTGVLRFPHWC